MKNWHARRAAWHAKRAQDYNRISGKICCDGDIRKQRSRSGSSETMIKPTESLRRTEHAVNRCTRS